MKKTLWTTVTLVFLLTGLLAAQSADEQYLKAMQLSDKCQQIQALDAYITQYAGKGGQYDAYAYAYYCLTPCATKNAQKAIDCGEKALAMSGIDETVKLQITFSIPSLYAGMGQMDKAKASVQRIIDKGKASADPKTAAQLQASGHVLLGQFAEKSGDYGAAAASYITAYGILKDPSITKQLNNLASTLYKSQKYVEAEKVFREFYAADQGSESASLLAQTLYKEGKVDEALAIYREAYAKKKTANLALNIAVILNKEAKTKPSLKPEAINALIEAGLLNAAQQKNLHQAALNLYISDSPDLAAINTQIEEHNKNIAEMTKTYNDKYGSKSDDDLTGPEKVSMKKLNNAIESEKQAIEQIKSQQKGVIDKFNQLVAQVRAKLGR
ncbi:MAG: tetratricopeptide repeat protein [Candidatus Aminicenantales bacterium]|jgi:tetratricopeptide (TPR) repeat protein